MSGKFVNFPKELRIYPLFFFVKLSIDLVFSLSVKLYEDGDYTHPGYQVSQVSSGGLYCSQFRWMILLP